MNRNKTSLFTVFYAALALAILTPGTALAADENMIIIELELDGASCPSTLVTISAQACDGDDLATRLEDELDAEFVGPVGCTFDAATGLGDCFWSRPSGCAEVRARASLEPGTTCGDASIQGQIFLPIGTFGVFGFEL